MFVNYPGTRAKAMGGAFVAVADDSSAWWYNPAGVATKGADLTLEFSTVPLIENDTYDTNETGGFLGIKSGGGNVGFEAFVHTPLYRITQDFSVYDETQNIY